LPGQRSGAVPRLAPRGRLGTRRRRSRCRIGHGAQAYGFTSSRFGTAQRRTGAIFTSSFLRARKGPRKSSPECDIAECDRRRAKGPP
jgi:hypothetical protein